MADEPQIMRPAKRLRSLKYAYSLKTHRVREKDFPYDGRRITCTADLVEFCRSLQDADIEKMISIYLDTQNAIIGIQVNLGTVNQAVVYPREVMRHALLVGASAMIMVHNHPSGYVKPSDSDIRLTRTIKEASKLFDIQVHDHLIIGEGPRCFSFREEGIMP